MNALRARSEEDEEEADDSAEVVPWTLSEARVGAEQMKIFFEANHQEHPELRKYMDAVEGIEKLLEKMTFSARAKQTTLMEHSFERRPGPQP